jgi:hypothetical protein
VAALFLFEYRLLTRHVATSQQRRSSGSKMDMSFGTSRNRRVRDANDGGVLSATTLASSRTLRKAAVETERFGTVEI